MSAGCARWGRCTHSNGTQPGLGRPAAGSLRRCARAWRAGRPARALPPGLAGAGGSQALPTDLWSTLAVARRLSGSMTVSLFDIVKAGASYGRTYTTSTKVRRAGAQLASRTHACRCATGWPSRACAPPPAACPAQPACSPARACVLAQTVSTGSVTKTTTAKVAFQMLVPPRACRSVLSRYYTNGRNSVKWSGTAALTFDNGRRVALPVRVRCSRGWRLAARGEEAAPAAESGPCSSRQPPLRARAARSSPPHAPDSPPPPTNPAGRPGVCQFERL